MCGNRCTIRPATWQNLLDGILTRAWLEIVLTHRNPLELTAYGAEKDGLRY